MPSKRKKNKRRIRRVLAQRRALEEQYAFSGKRTPRVSAVSVPITAQIPFPKTSKCTPVFPIKMPTAVVAPVEVPAKVLPAEPAVKKIPFKDSVTDRVVKDLPEAPVEPAVEEPAVIGETGNITVPVTEVAVPINDPVPMPAQSETHVLIEPVKTPVHTGHENEAVINFPAEDLVIAQEGKTSMAKSVAAVKPVTETTVKPDSEAAVEVKEPAVKIAGGSIIQLEAQTIEAGPLNIHTIAEDAHAKPESEMISVDVAGPTEVIMEAAGIIEADVEAVGPSEANMEAAGPPEAVVEAARLKEAVVEATGPINSVVEATGSIEAIVEDEGQTESIVEAAGSTEVVLEATGPTEAVVEATGPTETEVEATESIEAVKEVVVETTGPTEAVVKSGPQQQADLLKEPTPLIESTSDPVAEGFVVTETALAIEAAIPEEQIPGTTSEAPEVLSETLTAIIPVLQPVLVSKEIHTGDECMAKETDANKDLAEVGGLSVDAISEFLVGAEVTFEG